MSSQWRSRTAPACLAGVVACAAALVGCFPGTAESPGARMCNADGMVEVAYTDSPGPAQLSVVSQKIPSCEWDPDVRVVVRDVSSSKRSEHEPAQMRGGLELQAGRYELLVVGEATRCNLHADIEQGEHVTVSVWTSSADAGESPWMGESASARQRGVRKAVLKCRGF